MTNVALCCRVDHGSIAYGQFAIEQQKKQLELYARNNGFRVVGFYYDCGSAGNTHDRPGLNELQRAWKEGEFDAVVVVKRDRLHRGNAALAPVWPFKVVSLS